MENKYSRNIAKLEIELSEKQCNMAEIERYKESCEKGDGIAYYDSFRKHNIDRSRESPASFWDEILDIQANSDRECLARFWDEIIELWEGHALPSDFDSQNKLINAGTEYGRLVEPLDIAHYYGMSNGNGNYLSDGRPNRHKVLQKWMEEKEKTRSSRCRSERSKLASLPQDSCFWARVEEALKEMKNLEQGQQQKLERLEMFEDYATRLINDRNISSDVFLEGSSFMEWWKEWKEYQRNQFPEWTSPLYEIMETKSWKR